MFGHLQRLAYFTDDDSLIYFRPFPPTCLNTFDSCQNGRPRSEDSCQQMYIL